MCVICLFLIQNLAEARDVMEVGVRTVVNWKSRRLKKNMGRHLAQLVEWASQVQMLCPRCSGPGFESRPGALCCVSILLNPPLSLQAVLSI